MQRPHENQARTSLSHTPPLCTLCTLAGRGHGLLSAPSPQARQIQCLHRSEPGKAGPRVALEPSVQSPGATHGGGKSPGPPATCHLPGRPPWPWGEGKCLGPQERHSNAPGFLVFNSDLTLGSTQGPQDLCSLASLGFSQGQMALGRGSRVSRPTRGQPCVCVLAHVCTHAGFSGGQQVATSVL